jgi:hypothetical protein
MAVELKTSILKSFSTPKEFTVQDVSTWGSPSRASQKLVCLVDQFESNKFESVAVVPNNSAVSADQWTVKIDKDGYYKILLVAAVNHNPSISYTQDQVVFGTVDDFTGLFLSIDAHVPVHTELSDTYFWSPIEKIEDYPFLQNSGSFYCILDHIHDLNSRICIAEKSIKYAGNPCECPDEKLSKDYFWSLIFHHAAVYSAAFCEFKESGKFIDQVIDRCTNGSAEDEHDCGCHD